MYLKVFFLKYLVWQTNCEEICKKQSTWGEEFNSKKKYAFKLFYLHELLNIIFLHLNKWFIMKKEKEKNWIFQWSGCLNICWSTRCNSLGKPSKKRPISYETFPQGLCPAPSPVFLEIMEPMRHIWFLVTKKFPKSPKIAIF